MRENAVSEVIATVILIGIVTASVAIIGATLMKDNTPEKIPVITVQACKDDSTITLYHAGGDPLRKDEYSIKLLKKDRTDASPIYYVPIDQGSVWSPGETRKIRVDSTILNTANYTQIIANTNTGERIIGWTEIGNCAGVPPTPTASPTTTVTTTVTTTPTPTVTTTTTTTPTPTVTVTSDPCSDFTVAFSSSPNQGPAPLTVTFVDKSTGTIDSYLWSFGDGQTSTERNTTHTYTSSGIYQADLTANKNECGSKTADPVNIIIGTAYIINSSSNAGGTISPLGNTTVWSGHDQSYTITPSTGYIIADVVVDGTSTGANTTYTFTNVVANHTIYATFTTQPVCGTISGYVTNQTTGAGVGGITVTAYYNSNSNFAGSAVTASDGSYRITNLYYATGTKYDVYCLGSSTYTTVSPNPVQVLLNSGSKCYGTANFLVRSTGSYPADFLYNAAKKQGKILSGGSLQFVVADSGTNTAYIVVGGTRYDFITGDTIKLLISTTQTTGDVIYIGGSGITTFRFNDITVYQNGAQIARGASTTVNFPRFSSLTSSLVLDVTKGQNEWVHFEWDHNNVFPDGNNAQGVTIWNLTPDSSGILNVNLGSVYAKGHGEKYLLY